MAEKMKDWQSSIIWVIGLIFICGMTYKSVSSMDGRVSTNTTSCKENRQLIHKEEVGRIAMQGDIKSTREDVSEIKGDVEKLVEHLMKFDYEGKGK